MFKPNRLHEHVPPRSPAWPLKACCQNVTQCHDSMFQFARFVAPWTIFKRTRCALAAIVDTLYALLFCEAAGLQQHISGSHCAHLHICAIQTFRGAPAHVMAAGLAGQKEINWALRPFNVQKLAHLACTLPMLPDVTSVSLLLDDNASQPLAADELSELILCFPKLERLTLTLEQSVWEPKHAAGMQKIVAHMPESIVSVILHCSSRYGDSRSTQDPIGTKELTSLLQSLTSNKARVHIRI